MSWWLQNNLRMIQNNIRDIDGQMNAEEEIRMLKDFGANVLQIGCGGISSFIPTDLPFQRESPYLDEKMFGETVRLCHENDIKVIARFDLSKTHESFLGKYPEWFSRTLEGEAVRYNDTYATCINGDYQRRLSLEIISAAVKKYPVDGIFFNAFGYSTRDYSGRYIGICQCESCKKRFSEIYHKELPAKEDENDPVFQLYEEFKLKTVDSLLESIHDTVKAIDPNIAVSTYAHHMVDIVRNESNSAVDRPYPFWIYSSSENVSTVRDNFADKISSNCAINAVDIPYRFMGVSKYLNQIRLYGNLANGSGLDWCIIGAFEDYPDRENFETTREVFHFHRSHEEYFGHLKSEAKILLVQDSFNMNWAVDKEFRGIFKALKEEHRLFKTILADRLHTISEHLDDYELIIIPGLSRIEDKHALNVLRKTSAAVIVTGLGLSEHSAALKEMFGIELLAPLDNIRGSYLQTTPKSVFKSFEKRDWVYLDKAYRPVKILGGDTDGILPLVKPSMYGPPERCFGHKLSDIPCITVKDRFIYIPWEPGTLYYDQGYEDFKWILMNVIDSYADTKNAFETNAPNMVEIFFDKCGDNKYLLQLINMTGFNGTTASKPICLRDIEVKLNGIRPKEVYELTTYDKIKHKADSAIAIDELELYKAYLIEV